MFAYRQFLLAASLGLVAFLGNTYHSGAQEPKLKGLLQRSPAPANAAAYLHVPSLNKLMDDANMPAAFSNNLVEAWMISELNLNSLSPEWEAGYGRLATELTAEELSQATGGYMDSVNDRTVVFTPRQSYLVPLQEARVGFLRPANRSLLAKWLNTSQSLPVDSYLATHAVQPESFLSLMVAVSLRDLYSPVDLTRRLADFKSLQGSSTEATAEILASVQGLSLIVGRHSLDECILTVEFSKSPSTLAKNASDLLIEILNRNGTAAPEVASWKSAVDGNKLSFRGSISADTLDGVLGIFSIARHAEQLASTVKSSQSASTEDSRQVTGAKEYFDKVNAFIERVRKYHAQTTGYRASWDELQARRIDELPTLNVDPGLITYGSQVATILRNNATAIRGGNVAAGQLEASQASSSGYYGGYYGGPRYEGYTSPAAALNNSQVTAVQQQMAGFGSYREAIAAIDKLTGDVRREMTSKYSVQF